MSAALGSAGIPVLAPGETKAERITRIKAQLIGRPETQLAKNELTAAELVNRTAECMDRTLILSQELDQANLRINQLQAELSARGRKKK